jgi:hypothetical protein
MRKRGKRVPSLAITRMNADFCNCGRPCTLPQYACAADFF